MSSENILLVITFQLELIGQFEIKVLNFRLKTFKV